MKIVLFIIVGIAAFSLGRSSIGPKELQLYLAPIMVGLVGLMTYFLQRLNQPLTQDKAKYEATINLFNSVEKLISLQDNSRAVWLRAARDLLTGLELSKQLQTGTYKSIIDNHKESLRSNLYLSLQFKDEESGVEPLPLAFFLGLRNWKHIDSSTAKNNFNALPNSARENLDERSVFIIYNFINEYIELDPIEDIKFSECKLPSFGIQENASYYLMNTK